MAWTRVLRLVATLVLGSAGLAAAQSTAWLHVTVETRGATGEQVSTFRASASRASPIRSRSDA